MGGWVMIMVKLSDGEVSAPPALSFRLIVICELPVVLGVPVNVSVPDELIAGCTENNPGFVLPVT